VDAIEVLAQHVIFDVDTYVVDLPDDYTDIPEVDASCFIKARIPQEGWLAPLDYTYEEAVSHIDDTTFYDVIPGTAITFLVRFHNEIDGEEACFNGDSSARVFRARIVVSERL